MYPAAVRLNQGETGTYISEQEKINHYFNCISKPLNMSKAILTGRIIASNTLLDKISN